MPALSRFTSDEQLLQRARAEFLEMPGMRLTSVQAQRLWGLDCETCARLLDTLVDSGFLFQGLDRRYGRLFDGGVPVSPIRMAKAGLKAPKAATR